MQCVGSDGVLASVFEFVGDACHDELLIRFGSMISGFVAQTSWRYPKNVIVRYACVVQVLLFTVVVQSFFLPVSGLL